MISSRNSNCLLNPYRGYHPSDNKYPLFDNPYNSALCRDGSAFRLPIPHYRIPSYIKAGKCYVALLWRNIPRRIRTVLKEIQIIILSYFKNRYYIRSLQGGI